MNKLGSPALSLSLFLHGEKLRLTLVIPHLALNQFCHQSIQRPSAGSDELKDLFAFVLFSRKYSFNCLDLAFDAPYPDQHLFFVLAGVRQERKTALFAWNRLAWECCKPVANVPAGSASLIWVPLVGS